MLSDSSIIQECSLLDAMRKYFLQPLDSAGLLLTILPDGNMAMLEESMKDFIRVMKALSDQNRVKVMKMLEKKELCVCEITAILGLAQPTVSKHLKVLEGAGLVESRKDGPWVNYRLVQEHESLYGAAMQKHLTGWLTEDGEIRRVLERAETINREKICAS